MNTCIGELVEFVEVNEDEIINYENNTMSSFDSFNDEFLNEENNKRTQEKSASGRPVRHAQKQRFSLKGKVFFI